MSIGVTVIPPPGFPDPQEPVSAFANCPGNILTATQEIGLGRLNELSTSEATKALQRLIIEIDKGDAGKFSDIWCQDADLRWSRGREMDQAWNGIAPYVRPTDPPYMQTKRAYWGRWKRDQLRQDAVRFLLYFAAGYEIKWSP